MSDADDTREGLDKASQSGAQDKALTPRQREAARIRLEHPDWPEGRVLETAGFSKWTARCPSANGLDSFEFARQTTYRAEGAPTLKQIEAVALRRMHDKLSDPDTPDHVVGALAAAAIKLSGERHPGDQDPGFTPHEFATSLVSQFLLLVTVARCVSRLGESRTLELVASRLSREWRTFGLATVSPIPGLSDLKYLQRLLRESQHDWAHLWAKWKASSGVDNV